MSITDEWNEQLRCPKCSKTGQANLTQDDSEIATVRSVPDGFKVFATQYGPNFQCMTCNVVVMP